MRKNQCDLCSKIIDEATEAYYEIPEITYHVPGEHSYRMFFRTAESCEAGEKMQSWTSYEDITICIQCFWSEQTKMFRDIVEKRIIPND